MRSLARQSSPELLRASLARGSVIGFLSGVCDCVPNEEAMTDWFWGETRGAFMLRFFMCWAIIVGLHFVIGAAMRAALRYSRRKP